MPPIDSLACRECRNRFGQTRGLCPACYTRLSKLVRDGETTWQELEGAGRSRPKKRPVWRPRKAEGK